MNPNRVTLLQLAKEKVNAFLQCPIEEMETLTDKDIPFMIEKEIKGFEIYEPNTLVELPYTWTGLAYITKGFEKKCYWFFSQCEETGEREFHCLGNHPSPAEAVKAAVEVVHKCMIHWQADTIRQSMRLATGV